MKFEDVIGKEFDFYGVDGNAFKIGEYVFEAIEDEDDGYRSYLGSVEVKDPSGLIFFKKSLGKVTVEVYEEGDFEGYALIDENKHVWFRLGTDHSDDYYPYFVTSYTPPRYAYFTKLT